jgi:hypothetical protein
MPAALKLPPFSSNRAAWQVRPGQVANGRETDGQE